MKILITVLLLSISAFAQTYKVLGVIQKAENVGVEYAIDLDSISRKGRDVKFNGVVRAYTGTADSYEILPGYIITSTFTSNCDSYKWSEIQRKGIWAGETRDQKDVVKDRIAEKRDPIFAALSYVCAETKLKA